MKKILPAIFSISCAVFVITSCSGYSQKTYTGSEEQPVIKITADAYLYDAKVKREGKLNSFRLEFYQTDSVIFMSGRGYLGKGALKGWLSQDSLLVYFPTVNEYIYESTDNLFDSLKCSSLPIEFNLLKLFEGLPDSMLSEANIDFTKEGKESSPKYIISFDNNCSWKINLSYTKKSENFKIKQFRFENGDDSMLKAELREFREGAEIKSSRFAVPDLSLSAKIIP